MNTNIDKGTIVRVLTTNGGELVATLLETYRATYSALVSRPGDHYLCIPAWRIKSITVEAS